MPTRVVGYCRVSTEDQAERGVSLDAQRARLEQFAQTNGLELVEIVTDAGISAKSLERPGLQRALAMLYDGAGALLVTKLDRLTRSMDDWCELRKRFRSAGGAQLLVADQHVALATATDRFTAALHVLLGELEREQIAERTSTAMAHKAKAGEYTGGGAPYGQRLVGELLEDDPAEQETIALARSFKAQGASLRTIAGQLTAAGHLSRNGKPFAAAQIARILE